MGEPSKDFALPEERLASEESSEGQREECATSSTGRMAHGVMYQKVKLMQELHTMKNISL